MFMFPLNNLAREGLMAVYDEDALESYSYQKWDASGRYSNIVWALGIPNHQALNCLTASFSW